MPSTRTAVPGGGGGGGILLLLLEAGRETRIRRRFSFQRNRKKGNDDNHNDNPFDDEFLPKNNLQIKYLVGSESKRLEKILTSLVVIAFNVYFNTVTSVLFDASLILFNVILSQIQIQFQVEKEEEDDDHLGGFVDLSSSSYFSLFASIVSSLLLSPYGFSSRQPSQEIQMMEQLDSIHMDDTWNVLFGSISVAVLLVLGWVMLLLLSRRMTTMMMEEDHHKIEEEEDSMYKIGQNELKRWDEKWIRSNPELDANEDE